MKMWKLFVICCILKSVNTQSGMSFLGPAVEGYSPCPNQVLFMSREIGGPPSQENYWDGTFYLDNWPNISEVRLSVTVDNPAKIELNPEDGRVLVSGQTFHIGYFRRPPDIKKVLFTIRGRQNGKFPNLVSVTLNGLEVCENPKKWDPTILGVGNEAEITDSSTSIVPSSDDNQNQNQSVSKCGQRRIQHQGLITHGWGSKQGDWPWHTAIYHRNRRQSEYKCGGSLISKTAILTAAHCAYDDTGRQIVPERLLIQLGKYNLKVADINTNEYEVFKITIHEKYDQANLQHDIAIFHLATEVTYTNYIQPICLWDRSRMSLSEVENVKGTVVGWGYNEEDNLSDVLRQATMPVVPFATCLESDRTFFGLFLSDKNFCAGYRNGTSVCNGDSGGGMTFERNGVWSIRGIVSVSIRREDKEVCNPKHFVIFTDVAQYLDWIETNVPRETQ